jgi:anti-sigma factor RsiW
MSHPYHRVRFRLDHRWAPAHMSDYLDAELSSARGQRMERHVRECDECRRVLAGLRATLRALRAVRASSGRVDPARMAASVRLRLRDSRGPR